MRKPDSECDAATLRARIYMRKKRAAAKISGAKVDGWDWHKTNPEGNRAKTRRWREENPERWLEIRQRASERRRSTPWGRINNNVWCGIHHGLRALSSRKNPGKYERAFGYRYADLKQHLANQFDGKMTFENWGDVWEIDHILPCSSFQFESLEDPLFRQCWALSNLRPLLKAANQKKGSK
jgi:hypothetical protein